MRAVVDRESRELFEALCDCTLPHFSHEQHVRVAWLMLGERGLAGTLAALPGILRGYARSKGREDVYHETVTFAFTCLVNERLAQAPEADWPSFAASFPELFVADLLRDYYPRDVLESKAARETFVLARRSD